MSERSLEGQPSSNPPQQKRRRKRKRRPALALIRSYQKADWKRATGELKQSVPGLGVSFTIHIIVIVIMSWFVIRNRDSSFSPLELGWTTVVESNAEDPADEQEVIQPIVIPSVSMNKNASATEAETPIIDGETANTNPDQQSDPELKLADVSQSLQLRKEKRGEQDGDGQGAKKGTGREAIRDALQWLSRQQQSDGRWRLDEGYSNPGTIETDTGATALALLAFLGDGHTHLDGEFQKEVAAGLNWLAKTQKADGDFFDIQEQGIEAHFYSHAQATIAFCEALALTNDDSLRASAEKGVRFLEAAQNPELGGWKYRPLNVDGIGDLSVTGWALMALHSARMANIEVDFNSFYIAERFLDSVQEEPFKPEYYKYRPDFPVSSSQRLSMTAEGLLCRQWLGWPKNHLPMRDGVKFLISEKNLPEWKPNRRNVYAWYYTAQTLHNIGGENWKNWFERTLPLIVQGQQSSGKDRGSWHPLRPLGAPQERSQDAGRLYLTVMCVLILETPYRHAPLYGE
ncbi:MAG: terpene cyclase/mutase family protein [Planctomicrobium sp.]|jgi:hypothetical protein|nr:terpene cyclase/mutase family protein [Planctomicrobium sp.]